MDREKISQIARQKVDFECPICYEYYEYPLKIPMRCCKNDHICCKVCVQKVKNTSDNCPTCRVKLLPLDAMKQSHISVRVAELIKEYKLRCDNLTMDHQKCRDKENHYQTQIKTMKSTYNDLQTQVLTLEMLMKEGNSANQYTQKEREMYKKKENEYKLEINNLRSSNEGLKKRVEEFKKINESLTNSNQMLKIQIAQFQQFYDKFNAVSIKSEQKAKIYQKSCLQLSWRHIQDFDLYLISNEIDCGKLSNLSIKIYGLSEDSNEAIKELGIIIGNFPSLKQLQIFYKSCLKRDVNIHYWEKLAKHLNMLKDLVKVEANFTSYDYEKAKQALDRFQKGLKTAKFIHSNKL